MRNKRFAAAALAAFSAGCRPAPALPDPAQGVTLAAPAPSGATLVSPLQPESTGYTNEMQADNLRDQARQLGINRFGKPSEHGPDADEARAPITYQEGLDRTRELSSEFAAQRRAIDRDKVKTVALPGATPGMIAGRKEGAPIEPPADDPKGPEIK